MNVFSKRPLALILAAFMIVFALLLFVPAWVKVVLIGVFAVLLWVVIFRARKKALLIGLIISVIVASLLSLFYFNVYVDRVKNNIGKTATLSIEVVDISYSKNYVTYADVIITKIDDKKVNYPAKLECSYSLNAQNGEMFLIEGLITEIESGGSFDFRRYYNSKGYYLRIISEEDNSSYLGRAEADIKSFFSSVNSFCEKRLATLLEGDSFGLVSALFLGNRDNVDPSVERNFSQIGITPMLAVSGTHLTILIGGLYALLSFFGIHKRFVVLISIAVCSLYIGMTGAAPCILRSGLMYIIMAASALVYRENDSITSLFVASSLIVLFSPNSIYDAGFLLSVFSTFGILVVMPALSGFVYRAKQKGWIAHIFAGVCSGVVITLSASLFTLPLNAFYFGRIYALIAISNLLFNLLFTVLLWLSPFVVLLSYIPLFGRPIALICDMVCKIIISGSNGIASLDFGSVSLGYPFVAPLMVVLIAALALMFVWGVKNPFWCFAPLGGFCLCFGICAAVFLNGFNNSDYIACLNSDRNDLLAVHSMGNTAIIDITHGGRELVESGIIASKDNFYVDRIDKFILTHYHNFHPGTIDKIARSYFIETVYVPVPLDEDEAYMVETIKSICENNCVELRYYSSRGLYISDTLHFERRIEKIRRSEHEAIRVDIDNGSTLFSYFGSGVLEAVIGIDMPDTVFFGVHGPKLKDSDDLRRIKGAIYSNSSVKDSYKIKADKEYVINELNEVPIMRISKGK